MWKAEYTKRFLKELAQLPKEVRIDVEKIVFEDLSKNNPFKFRYLEKLKGHPDKYKIRVGNYRIGITIDKINRVLIFQRIAHRKDIYKIFP